MGFIQFFYCLEFNDHVIFNQNIRKVFPHRAFLVEYTDWNLTFGFYTTLFQFNQQSVFVYFFKETGSENSIHFKDSAADLICDVIYIHIFINRRHPQRDTDRYKRDVVISCKRKY